MMVGKNLFYGIVAIGFLWQGMLFAGENLPGNKEDIYLYFSFDKGVEPDYAAAGKKETKFSRESIAVKKDGVNVMDGMPVLEKGVSGRGLYMGNAVTNILPANTSDVEEGTDGFISLGKAELSQNSEEAWHGLSSLQVKTTRLLDSGFSVSARVTGGKYQIHGPAKPTFTPNKYVVSLYLKGEGMLRIYIKDETNNVTGKVTNIVLTKDWKRYSCYIDAESSAELVFYCQNAEGKGAAFWVDGLQLERKTPPGYYGPGETIVTPSSWTKGGTTREPDTLLYPFHLAEFPLEEGSLSFWFKPDYPINNGENNEFWSLAWVYLGCRKQLYSEILLWAGNQEPDGKSGSASSIRVFAPEIGWMPETWQFVTATWSNKEGLVTLYLNGEQIGQVKGWRTRDRWWEAGAAHGIGSPNIPKHKGERADAVLDDFTFWKKALTAAEVTAVYEAGKEKIKQNSVCLLLNNKE